MKLYFCDFETNKELEELNLLNIHKIENYSKIIGLAVIDSHCLYYIVYVDEFTRFKIKIKDINSSSFSGESSMNQVKFLIQVLNKIKNEQSKIEAKSSDYFYC